VSSDQKPPGEPRLDDMETHARGRLGELSHKNVQVAIQFFLQRGTRSELALRRRSAHAQRASVALNQGAKGRDIDPHHERHAEHSLMANQTDFESCGPVDGNHHRDVTAIGREVNMANATAGFDQRVGKFEFDVVTAREDARSIPGRKRTDQAIGGGRPSEMEWENGTLASFDVGRTQHAAQGGLL
jgi:hypothetical protein